MKKSDYGRALEVRQTSNLVRNQPKFEKNQPKFEKEISPNLEKSAKKITKNQPDSSFLILIVHTN